MTWQSWLLAYLLAGFMIEWGASRAMSSSGTRQSVISFIAVALWPGTLALIAFVYWVVGHKLKNIKH